MALFGQGKMLNAKEQFELSVRLYSPERDATATYTYGMNPKIYSQSVLSLTLLCLGQVDEALQVGIEALKAAGLFATSRIPRCWRLGSWAVTSSVCAGRSTS